MKLPEEDEDEIMHSGAYVEAFLAALNRDIGGDASTSLTSDPVLSNEPNQTSSLPCPNWQPSKQDENANSPGHQPQQQEQTSLSMDLKRHGSALENQQLQNAVKQEPSLPLHQEQPRDNVRRAEEAKISLQTPRTTGVQISKRHSRERPGQQPPQQEQTSLSMDLKRHGSALENQQLHDFKQEPSLPLHQKQPQDNVRQEEAAKIPLQTPRTTGVQISERHSLERPGNLKNQGKQIPFMLLLPALKPHLDKDREMQLQTLFSKLRKNEIAKEQFVRLMRNIVGDQVIRLAVAQLQPQGNAVPRKLKENSVEKQSSKVGLPSAMAGMQLNSISPSFATQLDPNVQAGGSHSTRPFDGLGSSAGAGVGFPMPSDVVLGSITIPERLLIYRTIDDRTTFSTLQTVGLTGFYAPLNTTHITRAQADEIYDMYYALREHWYADRTELMGQIRRLTLSQAESVAEIQRLRARCRGG